MTEHVHIYNFKPNNRIGFYDIDIFQCAYDEIVICVCNNIYNPESRSHLQFDIPIKKTPGFVWKCNKSSIGNMEGKAENIINLFKEYESFAWKSVQHLIFDHPKKSITPGL